MHLSKPIVVRDLKTLREVVLAAISEYGPSVDLNHINVWGVDRFDGLFKDTGFCGDVSKWSMTNARFTNEMFAGTPFNGDLSKWNFKRLEEARGMFKDSHFNGDVSQWNVGTIPRFNNKQGMFDTPYFSQDLTAWNIATVWEESCVHKLVLDAYVQRRLLAAAKMKEPFNATSISETELRGKSLEHYADIFGGQARLSEYLSRAPFGVMHFDACCASTACPVGIDQEDFEWSREILSVGTGLGLDNAGLRTFCVDQLGIRKMRTTESFSLDGMLGT